MKSFSYVNLFFRKVVKVTTVDPETVADLVDFTNSEDEFVNSCLSLTSTSMTSTPNTRYVYHCT